MVTLTILILCSLCYSNEVAIVPADVVVAVGAVLEDIVDVGEGGVDDIAVDNFVDSAKVMSFSLLLSSSSSLSLMLLPLLLLLLSPPRVVFLVDVVLQKSSSSSSGGTGRPCMILSNNIFV